MPADARLAAPPLTGTRPAAAPLTGTRPAGSRPAGTRPAGLAAGHIRVIVTAVLLLIVMAGVRSAAPAVAGRGPLRQDAAALGIAAEVVLAALEVALLIRARRSPGAGRQAVLLRTGLQWITGILMITIAAVAGADLLGHRSKGKIIRAITGVAPPKKPPRLPKLTHFTVTPFPVGYLVYGLLALVVLAAIIVCVLLVMRRRPGLPGLDDAPAEDAEELRQAVESGRVALHSVDDARAAIIACYVAMEASLARAGTARGAAETPDELLGRAAASGLLRGPDAGRLTVLFYEARFSTHDLPGTVRDDARHALDAISAELAGHRATRPPAPAEPANLAPKGAGR